MKPTDRFGFLPGIAERLDYYVYALRDPADGRIFYVGKGKGDRVFQHAAHARGVDHEDPRRLKLATIRQIHARREDVLVEVLRHGLTDEEAYEAEGAVIDALRLVGLDLTNRARGKWARSQGWASLDELRARYAAEPVSIDSERVVLIRINKAYRHGMNDDELYAATRQWWVLDPRRSPQHAFAVYLGVVRAVYRIDPDGWERDEATRRWRFTGARDAEMEARFAWRDVRAYWTGGAQNPIRYINC